MAYGELILLLIALLFDELINCFKPIACDECDDCGGVDGISDAIFELLAIPSKFDFINLILLLEFSSLTCLSGELWECKTPGPSLSLIKWIDGEWGEPWASFKFVTLGDKTWSL